MNAYHTSSRAAALRGALMCGGVSQSVIGAANPRFAPVIYTGI